MKWQSSKHERYNLACYLKTPSQLQYLPSDYPNSRQRPAVHVTVKESKST